MTASSLSSVQVLAAGLVCGVVIIGAVIALSVARRKTSNVDSKRPHKLKTAATIKEDKQRLLQEKRNAASAQKEEKLRKTQEQKAAAAAAKLERQAQVIEQHSPKPADTIQKQSTLKESPPPVIQAKIVAPANVEPVKAVLETAPGKFRIPKPNNETAPISNREPVHAVNLPAPEPPKEPLPLAAPEVPIVEKAVDKPIAQESTAVHPSLVNEAQETTEKKPPVIAPEAIQEVLQEAENLPKADAFSIFTSAAEEESEISKFAKTLKNVDISDLHKEVQDLAQQLKGWR
jgi:hypothetical protein